MTEQRTRMKIGIDGKVYTLDTSIQKSLTQIPWESRKKVIAVLEAIKQAEHVEKPQVKESVNQLKNLVKPQAQTLPTQAVAPESGTTRSSHANKPPLDTNSQDPDAIMQQLIMQQPSHNIPDKMTAIKWIAVFFAVIIALALII
ncbi:MAG: hypothetical protein R3E90_04480 [Marinicella sp.]|nr:hypothetical protein [Xanthomonadales bacterium]